MDSKEAEVYLETAKEQLKDAKLALKEKSYALSVFLSASSAENATSALIITLGAKPSRKHKNSLVIYRLAQNASPEIRSNLMSVAEHLNAIEPHITKARYPILKGPELLPPSKFYTRDIAEKILAQAQKVLEKTKQIKIIS